MLIHYSLFQPHFDIEPATVILLSHVCIFDDPSTRYGTGAGFGYTVLRPQVFRSALVGKDKGLRKEDITRQ